MSWLSAAFKGGRKNTFTGSQGAVGSLFHKPLQSPILPALATTVTGGNPWAGAAVGAAQGGFKRGGNIGSALGGGLQGYGTSVAGQGLLGGFQGMGAGGQGFFPGAMQGAKTALSQNIPGTQGTNPMDWFGSIGKNFLGMFQPQGMQQDPSLNIMARGGGKVAGQAIFPSAPGQQLSQQQLQGSPYQPGRPGFGYGQGQQFPGQSMQGLDPLWQQFLQQSQNAARSAIANATGFQYQPPNQPGGQPGGTRSQTGVSTGDTAQAETDPLKAFANFFTNNPLLTGAGITGAADLFGKKTELPSFTKTPEVQALKGFDPNNFQQLPQGMLDSINKSLDIKEEQENRNLRDIYQNARPGTDYRTDSSYIRDKAVLNRRQQEDRANAIMNPQLQFQSQQIQANQQRLSQLQELGQLSVSEIMARTGMQFEEAQQLKQQMGQLGSLFFMKALWPHLGEGIGSMSPNEIQKSAQGPQTVRPMQPFMPMPMPMAGGIV